MKKYILFPILLCIAVASCIKDRSITAPQQTNNNNTNTSGDSLLYYWNFNVDTNDCLNPTKAIISGVSLTYSGAYYDTAQLGTTLNAVGSDTIMTSWNGALRLRNPATGPFTLNLPTTGYDSIKLLYAEQRTSKGAQTNIVMYTTDGVNYINTAIASQTPTYSVDTNFTLISYDFSSDPNVNNNPNFAVQISFSNGNTNTSGNDRIDNITVYGKKQ